MIVSNIYTTDNGQSYHIDFDQTKDNINFTTLKTVKFLKYDDLVRLKDRIEEIINKGVTIKSLYIDREWETKCIDKICSEIRQNSSINLSSDIAILQLSYEYSGLMAQLMAHKLSSKGEPLDIEPVNIPYKNEFEAFIHPDQLDPYRTLIVIDSGCLSGNNFRKIEKKLLDYGYPRSQLFFTCVACDLNSIFRPDFCPIYFDGDTTMVHFWWETKTDKFQKVEIK